MFLGGTFENIPEYKLTQREIFSVLDEIKML